nr:hypothetical protein CFP56_10136 [Quercus suber]
MARIVLTVVVVLVALLYQLIGKTLVFVVFGVGRHVQSIDEFPYACRRIVDKRLQACEDMWLSEQNRKLYLACSDSESRVQWLPACVDPSFD